MATKLFLKAGTANGVTNYLDMETSAGGATTNATLNTTASGTQIQYTVGGNNVAWISGYIGTPFTLTSANISLWLSESNMSANIGGRVRIFKRELNGTETELGGGPFDDGVEYGTSSTEMTWTANVTDTSFGINDRIVVKVYATNVGTMASGYTSNLTYNGADGGSGDSFFEIAENVLFSSTQLDTYFPTLDLANVSSTTGSGTSLTWSHTVASGSNRILIVGVSERNNGATSGVTYNGVALSNVSNGSAFTGVQASLWYLLNPDVGTANVVVSFSSSLLNAEAGAVGLTNVNQSTPFSGTQVGGNNNNTNPSLVVSADSSKLIIDVVGHFNVSSTSLTVGANQRELLRSPSSGIHLIGMSVELGNSSNTMSWTVGSPQNWSGVATAINAFTNLTTTKTQTGVARISNSTTKNQLGKASIQVTTTQTQLGKGRIQKATSQTQNGVARIILTTTRTQIGKGAIQKTTTQTQLGKSSIRVTTTRTQTGVARIILTTSQNQTGKGAIQKTTTQTQLGTSVIRKTIAQTQTGKGRIQNTVGSWNQYVTGQTSIWWDGINVTGIGSQAWTNPINAFTVNNQYATVSSTNATNITNYIVVTGPSYDIPLNGKITGIVVQIRKRRDATVTTATDEEVRLYSKGQIIGDNKADTVTNYPTSNGYTTYGSPTDTWGLNLTGRDLDPDDVLFGPALSVDYTTSGTGSVYIDGFTMQVYYEVNHIQGVARITASTQKTQSGVSRIQATTTRTQLGKSAIQKTTTQTQLGKASIINQSTRTQLGVARIQKSVAQTQLGKGAIRKTTTQTQLGVGRIQKTVTSTQTGVSRITASTVRTQLGKGAIRKTTSQTQTGLARITVSTVRTQAGKGAIRKTTTQTQLGLSRIQKSVSATQSGVARIQKSVVQTQSGLARITASTTRTQLGKASIRKTTTQTQLGTANINNAVSRNQSGKASIRNTTTNTQFGKSAIQKTTTRTQTGVARIQKVVSQTQTGVSRIRVTTTRTQLGVSRILRTVNQTQLGLASIRKTTTQTQLGLSRITKSVQQTQSGVARIQNTFTQTQTGVARIAIITTQTQLGVSAIRKTTTRTQSGIARIIDFFAALNLTDELKANILSISELFAEVDDASLQSIIDDAILNDTKSDVKVEGTLNSDLTISSLNSDVVDDGSYLSDVLADGTLKSDSLR